MRARRGTALVGVLVVVATMLGSCGGSDDRSEAEDPVCADCKTYGQADSDITARPGEQFTIDLESNPTTGYAWAVRSNTDPSVAKKTASQYIAARPAVVGSGGVQRLVFEAGTKGATTIVLRYERSFETDDPSDKELTVAVTVT